MTNEDSIIKYLFEAGMLKRTVRSGWWTEGIKHPESVADHSFRVGIIAFILAKMEGVDPYRLCTAAVFHDMHEARIGDMNKLTCRYVKNKQELEKNAEKEQLSELSKDLRSDIIEIHKLSEKEKIILHDADSLECAFQAKEYAESGCASLNVWVDNVGKRLKTKSAKNLHEKMKKTNPNSWWKGLKKLD